MYTCSIYTNISEKCTVSIFRSAVCTHHLLILQLIFKTWIFRKILVLDSLVNTFYSPVPIAGCYIIKNIKSRRMRQVGHIVHRGIREMYAKILILFQEVSE
jgi:hypothetical protein